MGLLRFLLAIVVVLFHNGTTYRGLMDAHTAVKGFFIISGFYMALILDQKYGRSAAGIRAFAINRFLRLYPLYAVVLALTIGWYVVRLALLGDRTPRQAIFSMSEVLAGWQVWTIWLGNVSLLGLDFICAWDWVPGKGFAFLQGTANPPIEGAVPLGATVWVIQAWSISMEILFYLCAPFLARRKTLVLVLVIVASLGLDLWLSLGLHRTTYFFAPAQLYLFATGMLLHRVYKRLRIAERISKKRAVGVVILSGALAITWIVPLVRPEIPPLLPLLGIALAIPVLFALSKDSAWDRGVGNLSYPIYLCHMLVGQVLAVGFKRVSIDPTIAVVVVPVACVLTAMILHRIIEEPIEGIRSDISKRLAVA